MKTLTEPDRTHRGESGLRKKAWTLFSVIALIALVVGSLFGDRGILQLLNQRRRAEALAREIQELQAENQRLAEEIRGLRSDPRVIERVARERLGFARPGETLFLIHDTEAPAP